MKRFFPAALLVAVISLLLNAIWLSPVSAATMPAIAPLGQLQATGLSLAGAIDIDAAGNIYVADFGGKVFKFDRFLNQVGEPLSVQANGRGLAVTADGSKLYVSRASSVAVVNAATLDEVVFSGAPQAATFSQPGEIDLDSDGNVFVLDTASSRMLVNVYSAAGGYLGHFGGIGTGLGQFGQVSNLQLNGLMVDPLNRVVVTSRNASNANIVHAFTLQTGTLAVSSAAVYSGAGYGNPALSVPRGITSEGQQRIYVNDFGNGCLKVLGADYGYLGLYAKTTAPGLTAGGYDLIFDGGSGRLFLSRGDTVEVFGVDGVQNPVNANTAPTVPELQSPVGGSQVATLTPTLQFAASTDAQGDAISYQVVIKQGATVVHQASVSTTSLTVPDGKLAENATYSWTVQATDIQGASSAVSAAGSFLVNAVDDPPSVPGLTAPIAGEVLAGAGTLNWTASVDPDPADTQISYAVEVVSGGNVIMSATTSATSIALADFAAYASLVDGAPYSWRVVATDADGTASAAGAGGSFTYDTALLSITSNMPGAKVYLNGNLGYPGAFAGIAPLELRDLPAGPLSVVVERAGFEPFVTQVNVAGAANSDVYARLAAARRPAGMRLAATGIGGLTASGNAAPFLVDFDSDGQLDLLVGDAAGQLQLLPAMTVAAGGQLSFQAAQTVALPVLPGAVPFVADWNNDGLKDLLVGQADGTVTLFLNNGSNVAPTFAAGVQVQAGGGTLDCGDSAAPLVIDLNGDNLKDLVVGNAAGQLSFYQNKGTDAAPVLDPPVLVAQVAGSAVPASADWDGDGNRDLLVSAGGQGRVFLNNNGTLTDGGVVPLASGFVAAFTTDVNGVGGKDLLAGRADGRIDYWQGNGTVLVASYLKALIDKTDELAALVAVDYPAQLSSVTLIRSKLQVYNLPFAKKASEILAGQLPAGPARTSALELALLCL